MSWEGFGTVVSDGKAGWRDDRMRRTRSPPPAPC